MMLIGLNDMESTFDDGPLGTIILLGIRWHLVHWGYHDPYMVRYLSITIQFLTRGGSFHELLVIFMSYIFIILYFLTSELIFYVVCRLVAYIKYMILHL